MVLSKQAQRVLIPAIRNHLEGLLAERGLDYRARVRFDTKLGVVTIVPVTAGYKDPTVWFEAGLTEFLDSPELVTQRALDSLKEVS